MFIGGIVETSTRLLEMRLPLPQPVPTVQRRIGELRAQLGNQVVQVLSDRSGLAGEAVLVFEPAQALLFPEQVQLSEEERDLLTVNPA